MERGSLVRRAKLYAAQPPEHRDFFTRPAITRSLRAAGLGLLGQLIGVEFFDVAGQLANQPAEVAAFFGGHGVLLCSGAAKLNGPCVSSLSLARKKNGFGPRSQRDLRYPGTNGRAHPGDGV